MKAIFTAILLFFTVTMAIPQGNSLQLLSVNSFAYTTAADSELFVREVKTYDDFGNLATDTYYSWYSIKNKWIGSTMDEYTWDNNRNNILLIHYFWNYDLDTWREGTKKERTYDAANNMTSEALFYWNTDTKEWVGNTKEESSWNSSGKKTLWLDFYWTDTTKNWVPDLKTEYTYNTHGDEISNLTKRWTGADYLDLYYKTENTYNTSFKLTRSVAYDWDTGTSEWIIQATTDYIFDAGGNLTSSVSSGWPTTIHYGTYKYESTYDIYGNVVLFIWYHWNSSTSEWENKFKHEYSFNSRGDMTLSSSFSWDTTAVDWYIQSKYEYFFDQNGKKLGSEGTYWGVEGQNTYSRTKIDYIYSETGTLLYTAVSTCNSPAGPWKLNSKNFYSFKPMALIFPDTEINIFPNPFHDILYLGVPDETQYYSFGIYDMNGKKILTTTERTADLSALKQGVYSVRIMNKEGKVIKTSKVIKV